MYECRIVADLCTNGLKSMMGRGMQAPTFSIAGGDTYQYINPAAATNPDRILMLLSTLAYYDHWNTFKAAYLSMIVSSSMVAVNTTLY